MVTQESNAQPPEKRDSPPAYDIARVKEIAASGKGCHLAKAEVEDGYLALNFTFDDVLKIIAALDVDEDFGYAIRYPGEEYWHDVYFPWVSNGAGKPFKLYVKIRLNRAGSVLIIVSCHQERGVGF